MRDQDLLKRLDEIDERLVRLERLAFLGFQETREVSEYAYQQVFLEPEDVKRMSWFQRSFHSLSDDEALRAQLTLRELVELKQSMRHLRKQARMDALGIVRDLLRRKRADVRIREAA